MAFGTAPAGGRAAPGQRLGEALIAAHMRDDQRVRQAVGKPEPPGVISAGIGRRRSGSGHSGPGICQSQSFLGPDDMLHRERLTGTQQRAIHDRMRTHLRLARTGRGDIETPRLDAFLPAAPDKAHVLHAMVLGPGADEVARHAAAAVVVLSAFPGERLQTREAGHPLGIGRGFCLQLSIAVRDPNPGIGHRPPLVQCRHPGQTAVTSLLEMHPQVRHQHRGAHIHRTSVPIAGVQQGLSQLTGGHFQHMETGRQGNAQDLEGPNIALRHVRKRLRLHLGQVLQQRDHARFHVVGIVIGQGSGQRVAGVLRRHAAVHDALIVMVHPTQPADDLTVFPGLQLAQLQPGSAQRLGCRTAGRVLRRQKVLHGHVGLHAPHRQGQQGRAIRSLGKALDDAEGGRAELGQRWQCRRPDGERETGGIEQCPAAGIVQVVRHHQRIGGLLGQGRSKAQRLDHPIPGLRRVRSLEAFAIRARPLRVKLLSPCLQMDLGRQCLRNRCAEVHRDRPDRHAARLGILALAAHLRRERLAHLEVHALHLRADHAVGHRHTTVVDQRDLGSWREAALTLQHGQRRGGRAFTVCRIPPFGSTGRLFTRRIPQAGQDGLAPFALHQAHRHLLAQIGLAAPDMLLQAGYRGRCIQAQHEHLILFDGVAFPGTDPVDARPACVERMTRGLQQDTGWRPVIRPGGDLAADAGRQGRRKVLHPFLGPGPATAAQQ